MDRVVERAQQLALHGQADREDLAVLAKFISEVADA